MSNLELLDRAASAATCQFLSSFGSGLIGASVMPLWSPGGQLAALSAGSLSLLAANYLCADMPMGGTPVLPGVDGCQRMSDGGYGQLEYSTGNDVWGPVSGGGNGDKATQITDITVSAFVPGSGYAAEVFFEYVGGPENYGWTTAFFPTEQEAAAVTYRITPISGTCAQQGGQPTPITPEMKQPISYTDPVTNCNYNISFQGFAQETPGGTTQPVYLIEGASALRNDGGRMGGCNFEPTIYMPANGGGGGGGTYLPVPPGGGGGDGPDGLPWWVGPLAGALAGAVLNQLADVMNNLLLPQLDSSSFTLTAPCNKDEQGNPLQTTWDFPTQDAQSRLLSHQVALMEIIQQQLDWKTPICDEHPLDEGDFRTISFRSEQTSPYGKSRLRKRFRYRAVSGNDLSAVIDHWKDFSFEAGPYRVRWVGGAWRSPEIWAATEAEGQRVIEHAAVEAGVSPLEGGRWSTRLSGSTRQGVPGTMKIDTTGGYYWITARDGSSERPLVGLT